jgi:hypothetical protein
MGSQIQRRTPTVSVCEQVAEWEHLNVKLRQGLKERMTRMTS